MLTEGTWQSEAVERLSVLLKQDRDVRALILTGSVASSTVVPDEWSDVDAKVVVADHALNEYAGSTQWLAPLGRVIGLERHRNGQAVSLRICSEQARRFDIMLIPESSLTDVDRWEWNPFLGEFQVMWSKIPNLADMISSIPRLPLVTGPDQEGLCRIVDQFWFKAAAALGRVARNDLLVGLHLGLDLVRDCLLLQMLLRDRELGTNIHREGGWGNEIAQELCTGAGEYSAREIVAVIANACDVFDRLALELCPGYTHRAASFADAFESAEKAAMDRES